MKVNWPSIIVLSLALVGCKEEVRRSYSTIVDAKPEVEKGWIPRVLPASTVEIHESHNLDLNTGQGTFSFGQADMEQFKKSLTAIGENESLRVAEINRARLKQEGFNLYQYQDFYLAVNWTQCRGQFWLKYQRG